MAKKIVLTAPNLVSRGLRNLAKSLSRKVGYRVYRVTSDRVRRRTPVVFLSGIDKRSQLHAYKQYAIPSPEFCVHHSGIDELDCKRVVARALTNASEGRGITIFVKGTPPPPAPLYTEYIPKKKEFRVHVWNNKVIDVAEKRKRKGYIFERDTQVRNTANGYVFCRADVVEPDNLRAVALGAVACLGRTYGAVDVIWNQKRNICYVLEVNSRPGMEGTTVEKYADAIIQSLKEKR